MLNVTWVSFFTSSITFLDIHVNPVIRSVLPKHSISGYGYTIDTIQYQPKRIHAKAVMTYCNYLNISYRINYLSSQ